MQLAPGDHITAGAYPLQCARAGDRPAAAGGAPAAIESRVDATCIAGINLLIDGRPPVGDAMRWADGCRPFEIAAPCTVTSTKPDDDCFAALNQVISGSFSAAATPRAVPRSAGRHVRRRRRHARSITGKFTAGEVGAAARACRTLELRCQ